MKSILKLLPAFFSVAILAVLVSAPSHSMPIPASGFASDNVTLVAQGCGPGRHRGPYGHCRALYTCPPGWHTGPYGKVCTRNR